MELIYFFHFLFHCVSSHIVPLPRSGCDFKRRFFISTTSISTVSLSLSWSTTFHLSLTSPKHITFVFQIYIVLCVPSVCLWGLYEFRICVLKWKMHSHTHSLMFIVWHVICFALSSLEHTKSKTSIANYPRLKPRCVKYFHGVLMRTLNVVYRSKNQIAYTFRCRYP